VFVTMKTKQELIKAGWTENPKAYDQWLTIGKKKDDYRSKDYDYNISKGQEHLLGLKLEVKKVEEKDNAIMVKAQAVEEMGTVHLPHIYFKDFKTKGWRKVEYKKSPFCEYRSTTLFEDDAFHVDGRLRSKEECLKFIRWAATCLGYKVLKK